MMRGKNQPVSFDDRSARLLQAVQMTSVGMSHMLLLAYERIADLEGQGEELTKRLEEVRNEPQDNA